MMKCTAVSARFNLRVLSVPLVKEDGDVPSADCTGFVYGWHKSSVRAAGVRIICGPPTLIQGLYSHPALICHSLCPDDWRGAEEQNNYDIMAGWLSSSPSWAQTEDRNGQHESNTSHRKAIHHIQQDVVPSPGGLGGGKIRTNMGLDLLPDFSAIFICWKTL